MVNDMDCPFSIKIYYGWYKLVLLNNGNIGINNSNTIINNSINIFGTAHFNCVLPPNFKGYNLSKLISLCTLSVACSGRSFDEASPSLLTKLNKVWELTLPKAY